MTDGLQERLIKLGPIEDDLAIVHLFDGGAKEPKVSGILNVYDEMIRGDAAHRSDALLALGQKHHIAGLNPIHRPPRMTARYNGTAAGNVPDEI